jgi:nitrate reductase gamma subunit
MHTFYNFVSGPLAWIAFLLFFGGSVYRIVRMLMLVAEKERFIFTYMSWRYSLRSILHWIIPFATVNWRRQPVLTVVTFAFHICLVAVPLFLLSHAVLWDEAFSISWWTLPDAVADVMTVIVILGAVYFLVRRLTQPEVRFVTSASDFVILAIVAAPFVTGFLAYHQWLPIRWSCACMCWPETSCWRPSPSPGSATCSFRPSPGHTWVPSSARYGTPGTGSRQRVRSTSGRYALKSGTS